jgi:hypothetical protein
MNDAKAIEYAIIGVCLLIGLTRFTLFRVIARVRSARSDLQRGVGDGFAACGGSP